MLNPDFDTRLDAALAMVDKNSTATDVVEAFRVAVKLITYANFGQLIESSAGRLQESPGQMDLWDPGKPRMASWIREMGRKIGTTLGVHTTIRNTPNPHIFAETVFEQRLVPARKVFEKMVWAVEVAATNALRQEQKKRDIPRGEAKTFKTDFREALAHTLLGVGVVQKNATEAEVATQLDEVRVNVPIEDTGETSETTGPLPW